MTYDYYYGGQSEQFSFYRIPKVLFTEKEFSHLSTDAKLVYGLFVDRMSLSRIHNWIDRDNKVYIIYTLESIMESLGCGKNKACQLLAELDKTGLIERKRQGLGKPSLIYVKNFISAAQTANFLKFEKQTSGCPEKQPLDVRKVNSNKTDMTQTYFNDTDSFFSSDWDGWELDELQSRADYEQYFREQFQFEFLLKEHPYDEDMLNELLNLVVDTVCSKRKSIRIASDDKPLEVVKSVFMKLDRDHITFVLDGMRENTTLIRNMKQYLLAALYNAPLTISNYYSSLVQHHESKRET